MCTAFFCNSRSVEESWFGNSGAFNPQSVNGSRRHWTIYNAVDTEQISQVVAETDRQTLRTSMGLGRKTSNRLCSKTQMGKGADFPSGSNGRSDNKRAGGDGSLWWETDGREMLRKKSRRFEVRQSCEMAGAEKTLEEVDQLYSIMDVVAVPSLFEGSDFPPQKQWRQGGLLSPHQ